MISLIQRNLKMFFRSPSTVILSILGAMISFILYIVFLKSTISSGWGTIADKKQILDTWLIGGTLAITALTTTLSALDQLDSDQENGTINDFYVTGVHPFKLAASYFLSASMIGLFLQLVMFGFMLLYFGLTDQVTISLSSFGQIILLMIYASIFSSAFNYVFVQFVTRLSTLSKIEAVLGTLTGFLVGVYLPVGALPSFAQNIVKLYPGAYLASLNRRVLVQEDLPAIFKEKMGIGYNTTQGQDLAITFIVLVICMILIWALPQLIKRKKVNC